MRPKTLNMDEYPPEVLESVLSAFKDIEEELDWQDNKGSVDPAKAERLRTKLGALKEALGIS